MVAEHIVDAGGRVEITGADTSEPWTLDIDCMLVSAAAYGLGQLGESLRRRFPAIPFDSVDVGAVTSTSPRVLEITGDMVREALSLRWLVLVNVREDVRGSAEGAASVAAVRRATLGGLTMAAQVGATRVGLPLLGTGVAGLDRGDVVSTLVAAVEEFATGDPGGVESIVVFDRSAEVVGLLGVEHGRSKPGE